MKKLIPLIGFVALFLSCDKVNRPIVPKPVVAGKNFVKNSNLGVVNIKKTLLEDYTGQTCPNCPTGATVAKNLSTQYGDALVVLAVHQGNTFAQPIATYTNDFRTVAGEAWGKNDGAGFGIAFWPCGLVNRKKYNNNILIPNQAWPSAVNVAKDEPFILQLLVKTEYDTVSRALNVNVKGSFKQAFAGAVKLVIAYMQDSIVGKQKDGGIDKEEYEFEHMMRGDITGPWGREFANAAAIGDTVSFEQIGYPLPSKIGYPDPNTRATDLKDKKVSIVVFAYDVATKNVLQVEKVKIRP